MSIAARVAAMMRQEGMTSPEEEEAPVVSYYRPMVSSSDEEDNAPPQPAEESEPIHSESTSSRETSDPPLFQREWDGTTAVTATAKATGSSWSSSTASSPTEPLPRAEGPTLHSSGSECPAREESATTPVVEASSGSASPAVDKEKEGGVLRPDAVSLLPRHGVVARTAAAAAAAAEEAEEAEADRNPSLLSGLSVAANTAASAVATKKKTVVVFDPEFKVQWTVPTDAVVHYPPTRMNITRLVQCRNYRMREPSSCSMGLKCKFVHIDLDCSKLPSTPIHINYVWRSELECLYRRLPPGPFDKLTGDPLPLSPAAQERVNRLAAEKRHRRLERREQRRQEECRRNGYPSGAGMGVYGGTGHLASLYGGLYDTEDFHNMTKMHRLPDDEVDSVSDAGDEDEVNIVTMTTQDGDELHVRQDCLLVTLGALSMDDAESLMVCEDYHKSAMCSSGQQCSYVHPVVVDTKTRDEFKRVGKRCRLASDRHHRVHMIPDASANHTNTNTNTNSNSNSKRSNAHSNHNSSMSSMGGAFSSNHNISRLHQSIGSYMREDLRAETLRGSAGGWMVEGVNRPTSYDGMSGPAPRMHALRRGADDFMPPPLRGGLPGERSPMPGGGLAGYYSPPRAGAPSLPLRGVGISGGPPLGSRAAGYYSGAAGRYPAVGAGYAGRTGGVSELRAKGSGAYQLPPGMANAVTEASFLAAANYLQQNPGLSHAGMPPAELAQAALASMMASSGPGRSSSGPSAAAEPFYPPGTGGFAAKPPVVPGEGLLHPAVLAATIAAVQQAMAANPSAAQNQSALAVATEAALTALSRYPVAGGMGVHPPSANPAAGGVDDSPFLWDTSSSPDVAAAAAAAVSAAGVDPAVLEGGTVGYDSGTGFGGGGYY